MTETSDLRPQTRPKSVTTVLDMVALSKSRTGQKRGSDASSEVLLLLLVVGHFESKVPFW